MKRAMFVTTDVTAQGTTPLHMACLNEGYTCSPSGQIFTSDKPPCPEYGDVVRLLLAHGADPKCSSSEARTHTIFKHFFWCAQHRAHMACSSIAFRARSACHLVYCASAILAKKLQTWHCKEFCISLLVYLNIQTSPASQQALSCCRENF